MFIDFDSYILLLFTPVLKKIYQNVKNSIDIELILKGNGKKKQIIMQMKITESGKY
jgi:hypothetical protein